MARYDLLPPQRTDDSIAFLREPAPSPPVTGTVEHKRATSQEIKERNTVTMSGESADVSSGVRVSKHPLYSKL